MRVAVYNGNSIITESSLWESLQFCYRVEFHKFLFFFKLIILNKIAKNCIYLINDQVLFDLMFIIGILYES